MQDFEKLNVFKKSFNLSKEIYGEINNSKNLRLKSQLFGSATSIPANLAEMTGYKSNKHQASKIQIAIGEAKELHFWLLFWRD